MYCESQFSFANLSAYLPPPPPKWTMLIFNIFYISQQMSHVLSSINNVHIDIRSLSFGQYTTIRMNSTLVGRQRGIIHTW